MTGTISAVGAGGAIELKPGASAVYSITNAHEFIGTVQVQRSTDLVTWAPIQSWVGTNGARLTGTVGAGILKNESAGHEYYRVSCIVFDALSDNLEWALALDLAAARPALWVTELITIAAAATSDSVADLLPANAIIEAVIARVVATIPTATSFTIGDGTTAARFATGVAVAADGTFVGLAHMQPDVAAAAGPVQASAAKLRITPAGGTPASNIGRVLVTVFYRQYSV